VWLYYDYGEGNKQEGIKEMESEEPLTRGLDLKDDSRLTRVYHTKA